MDILKIRNQYVKEGYTNANASAKVCQDIILNEIAQSAYFKNVTIKGGVVMHSISKDLRRATIDIDLDFIKYSLEDSSIVNFIRKLNNNKDNIQIEIEGKIEKLHHQDYDGKRVNVKIINEKGNSIHTKLDIGVHKNFDIEQEEYCFDLNNINTSVKLLINSKEQIFLEKLKSLLKFGIISTRYKDIFDFYYLINNTDLDKNKFLKYIDEIIFKDEDMQVTSVDEIIQKLNLVLNNKRYIKNLKEAKNNWLNLPVRDVIDSIILFFESLEVEYA